MNYPPQEPGQQAYFPPSEVYHPEQQEYASPQIAQPPPVSRQTIAVYANRKQAMLRMALLGFLCIVVMGILLALSVLLIIFPMPPDARIVLPMSILLVIFLAEAVWIGWMLWRWYALLIRNREPLLVIDHRGITVGKLPNFSGFFIPWHEIESISSRSFLYKYLCIRPKNTKQFLEHFNAWQRFTFVSNNIFGIARILVPQIYLAQPVEEILHQVYYMYANELGYYRIALRSS